MNTATQEETSMKFYTQTHTHYCGIDLHARNLYVCILNQEGDVLVHKNIKCLSPGDARYTRFDAPASST
jgi:hypothetical protein